MNKQTAQWIEKHFDTAFAAPDGIKKLRELILTLAMQGRLVPQDPRDQPASELLKEIEAEKRRLVKEGKIKAAKPLPEIKAEDLPYGLPVGWKWVRLGNIGEINPRNNTADNVDAGFVPMPLIFSGYGLSHQFEKRKWEEIKKGYTHFANEDVGLAKITPCFENAKSCIFRDLPNGIGAGTTELHIFRNTFGALIPEYLLAYLKNPKYIGAAIPKMTGSAGQKRVPTDFFIQNPFPLPPLPEQHRIVAKINQLMARCDELEKLRAEQEQKRLAVHTSAIKRLLDAQTKNSFDEAWQFITRHFGALYSVKDNVTELRKAILQLAVMGKLVPQNPSDPPASELLKEIEAEKRRLVKEGKIKSPKPLPKIEPEEMPYGLPDGWEWWRFDQLINQQYPISYGVLVPGPDVDDGVPFVRIEDLSISNTKESPRKRISQEIASKYERTKLVGGEILMGVVGSIGKLGIAPDSWKDAYIARAVCRIAPSIHINKHYILWILQSDFMQSGFTGDTRTLAQPTLNIGLIKATLTPIPPLPEQNRIVAKIDQLMSLCDALEQQIDAAEGKQTQLLSALMAQV